jgi:hypothetical protein
MFPAALWPWESLAEMSIGIFPEGAGKAQQARKTAKLTAVYEPIA